MKRFAFFFALLAVLPTLARGADEKRWFRGVESVSAPAAGIDEKIRVVVRDLDGWLYTEMERKHILGEKHFQNNQLELFLTQWQQARQQAKTYGDLMRAEQDRLDKVFASLLEARRDLQKRKAAATAAAAPSSAPASGAAAPPAAVPAQASAPAQSAPDPLAAEEKKWKEERQQAEADQRLWFARWQAFQGYQALLHEVKESLFLVLNGARLTQVKARNPFDAGHDASTITRHDLDFVLKQHPTDKAEWDKLYQGMQRYVPASVAVGFDMEGHSFTLETEVQPIPFEEVQDAWKLKAREAGPSQSFALITYGLGSMLSGLGLVVVAFLAFLYLASRTDLVRDPGAPTRPDGLFPFSLARCQMAFWFFLFAAAYIFLWVVKRQTDTLTDQCLILLGISTGTTVGVALLAQKEETRSAEADGRVESREEYLRRPAVERFGKDLVSEAGLVTFHRFQMVIWTLVLGLVFIRSVCGKLQMPEFGTNELTLMGISAGAYIGFTLPAAPKPPGPPVSPDRPPGS